MIVFSGEAEATLQGVSDLRLRLERALADLALADSPADDIALAVAELASNAVRHGDPRPTRLRLVLAVDGHGLTIDFSDDGGAFPEAESRLAGTPAERPTPLDTGGRGIWLIRNAVDRVAYRREDGNAWRLYRAHLRDRPGVLVVEDDAGARAIHRAVLGEDYRLAFAESLAEARDAMTASRFDLILADFHVEDGTAADLLAEVDKRGDGLQTPVVFVTADMSGMVQKAAESLGVHSVLHKPLRAAALKERAAAAIATHRTQEARLARRLLGDLTANAVSTRTVTANGLRLVARGATASMGGGDLFLDLGGGERRRFLLADCMGHGVKARLKALTLAGMAAGLIGGVDQFSPSAFVDALSRALRGSPLGENLIATVLVIDLVDGRVELATGGHPGPLLLAAGSAVPVDLVGGLPGVLSITGSRTRAVNLAPGERLLAATDGLAPDSADTLTGMPGSLLDAAAAPGAVASVADAVADSAVTAFGHQPADDWTFVLIEPVVAAAEA